MQAKYGHIIFMISFVHNVNICKIKIKDIFIDRKSHNKCLFVLTLFRNLSRR